MFPHLFQLGDFLIPTYGVLLTVAVFVAIAVAARLGKAEDLEPSLVWNLGLVAVLAAVLGAKALMVISDWEFYSAHPRALFSTATLQAGGIFYGGLVAAVAAVAFYCKRRRIAVLKVADVAAPPIAIGHAIGRLGCFAAGCCYGKPTALPWGVTFKSSLAHGLFGTPLATPLHPTQLYEVALELANFCFLAWLLKRKRFQGQVAAAYLLFYGIARFWLDFLRADAQRGSVFGGAMTVTQVFSVISAIGGAALWAYGALGDREGNP